MSERIIKEKGLVPLLSLIPFEEYYKIAKERAELIEKGEYNPSRSCGKTMMNSIIDIMAFEMLGCQRRREEF